MSFKEDLIKARGHIAIISAIVISLSIIPRLEKYSQQAEANVPKSNSSQKNNNTSFAYSSDFKLAEPEKLSEQEKEFAKTAWKYFENNYNKETGLVNSVNTYKASTMWDTASYLLALISAHELGLVSNDQFNKMMSKALNSLSKMKLFDDQIPNKSYSTTTLDMVNYVNKKTDRGIGWSALDVGRLILPLYINIMNYPEHANKSREVIKRFKTEQMIRNGILYGAFADANNNTKYIQEGRLGYEEYVAKIFNMVGFNAKKAALYDDNLSFIDTYNVQLPIDSRDPKKYKAHNYVVSEPYMLDGLETGYDPTSKEFAYRVYKAQEERFKNTGILTAVSEDNIDKKPYFVYNTVFSDGVLWNCITDKGEDASEFKSLSTKAVFGWHSIYRNEYTSKLMDKIKTNFDKNKGWYSGIYEKDNKVNKSITCNTNAIILESLYYKQFGKLINLKIR